ncbi:Hypothetical protein NTJ_04158 [Nesidiocoris tenuis]|uniref:Uncharacterized protein n=1 Tax=Nesidiocoris tenuis TaxID=355587 RepID=A0ABN7AKG1_9HEMI|nr:Hypothetical protein NTJ_04158 [Nesidiocoris tenuis]
MTVIPEFRKYRALFTRIGSTARYPRTAVHPRRAARTPATNARPSRSAVCGSRRVPHLAPLPYAVVSILSSASRPPALGAGVCRPTRRRTLRRPLSLFPGPRRSPSRSRLELYDRTYALPAPDVVSRRVPIGTISSPCRSRDVVLPVMDPPPRALLG